jgi:hypothetical protein
MNPACEEPLQRPSGRRQPMNARCWGTPTCVPPPNTAPQSQSISGGGTPNSPTPMNVPSASVGPVLGTSLPPPNPRKRPGPGNHHRAGATPYSAAHTSRVTPHTPKGAASVNQFRRHHHRQHGDDTQHTETREPPRKLPKANRCEVVPAEPPAPPIMTPLAKHGAAVRDHLAAPHKTSWVSSETPCFSRSLTMFCDSSTKFDDRLAAPDAAGYAKSCSRAKPGSTTRSRHTHNTSVDGPRAQFDDGPSTQNTLEVDPVA